jgi:Domain of unknown function (DUF4783)
MFMRRYFTLGVVLLAVSLLPGYSQEQRKEEGNRTTRPENRASGVSRGEKARQVDPKGRKPRLQMQRPDQRGDEHFWQRGQSLRQIRPDPLVGDPRRIAATAEHRRIFESIQGGLRAGNVGVLSQHFGSQVLCNLRDGESGYYSASQAFYLLQNYFSTRRLVAFDFSTIGESESNPYATGSVSFNVKGRREVAQVYVSLSQAGDRWVISQINIY